MRTQLPRQLASAALAWVVFVVNPAYLTGCLSSGGEPSAAQQARAEADLVSDMQAVNALGVWEFAMGNRSYEVSLLLERQKGEQTARLEAAPVFFSRAHACGTKTFFQRAAACATNYQLAVVGTMSLHDLTADKTVVSNMPVHGMLAYEGSELTVSFGDDPANVVELHEVSEGDYELLTFRGYQLGADGVDVVTP